MFGAKIAVFFTYFLVTLKVKLLPTDSYTELLHKKTAKPRQVQ